jgi:lipopolysaccharide transport system permease protein
MNKWKYRIITFLKYKDLIVELVSRDIKLKYRRSFLGYVWSVLNPLLIMLVMTIVFSAMFQRNIENYPVYLLLGRMTFEFMKTSTNNAMNSVTKNSALLKKTYIPKYIFTVAKVMSCMVDYVLTFGALIIVMIATRAPFYPTMLLTPYVIIQLVIFCLGMGFLLGALNVFFRDITYIYAAVTTAWMYLTPVFYPISVLPETIAAVLKLNPLYYYVSFFRGLVLDGIVPGVGTWAACCVFSLVSFVAGLLVFRRLQKNFILHV